MQFRDPDLAAVLQGQRDLLDRIFGEAAYEIESSAPREASVRSSFLKLDLGFDPRDRSVDVVLTVSGAWGSELDGTDGWARFLGEEIPPSPRNASGHVTLSPEEQIRAELQWAVRMASDVFSHTQKTRDAVNFVRGYRQAYNDWASGAW
jgi:hypothetical protein